MSNNIPRFFEVDNAAQIFVAINSLKETTMSRIALTLDNPVNRKKLEQALRDIIKRFPYFQVYLRKHFFTYIFEHTDDIPVIEDDTKWTNRYIDFEKSNFPFKIKLKDRTIAIELSHILSDGYGTLVFLLSLVARYMELNGINVEEFPLIKTPDSNIIPEEWECAFRKKFPKKGPPQRLQSKAYIPTGKMISVDKYFSTRFVMNLVQMRTLSRAMNVTLNVYISAIYTAALQELFLEDIESKKVTADLPLRIQIPVNLRKYYPTATMRNFSYFYSPIFYINDSPNSFQEIVHSISDQIRHERHSHSVEHQIARNLRAESHPLFKFLPRTLKTVLFRFFYHIFARSLYSGVLSNLGDIKLPPTMENHVERFDIIPCNSPVPGRNTAVFSYKGKLEINIGSSVNDLRLENKIENLLTELGIDYEVIYKKDN